MKIYLSGPMSGIPEHNYPYFNLVATMLRSAGFNIINPAELNPDTTRSWHDCLRVDLIELAKCDAICLLDGWENSDGANFELHVAHRLKLTIFPSVDHLLRSQT
jgi:nucleoside 2-deoxyribosyltransferase